MGGGKVITLLKVRNMLSMVRRTQTQCRACHEFGHNASSCDNWICDECGAEFNSESARMQHGDAQDHDVDHD
jgi:ribosomal protein L37AE/L43A